MQNQLAVTSSNIAGTDNIQKNNKNDEKTLTIRKSEINYSNS